MDMLRFFLDLYDRCQRNFTEVDSAILDADPSDLVQIAAHASGEIQDLYGGKVELNRAVDTAALVSRWAEGHGPLGPYHLLSGLERLLADMRLEVQERAAEILSEEHRAVIPNSFRLGELGSVHVARRVQENISKHLHEFRVAVSPDRARIRYVPIVKYSPPRFREEWGALNDSLAHSQQGPCLRVVCANFSHRPTDFRICTQRAQRGWAKNYGTTFWFDQANPVLLETLRAELREILRQCSEIQAQVLVLPELTMPEELIAEVENHCREQTFPILTIAGSWHVQRGSRRRNRAPIYAGSRRMRVHADKMYRFTMTPSEVREFVAHVPVDGEVDRNRDASEEIALGDSIVILDTDVGRLAIGICIDAIMSELKHTLETLGVNYLFVPARSKSSDRFMFDLKTFCEHCAAFFCFANTPSAVKQGDMCSFILFPTRPTYAIVAGKIPENRRPIRACEEKHAVLEPGDFNRSKPVEGRPR